MHAQRSTSTHQYLKQPVPFALYHLSPLSHPIFSRKPIDIARQEFSSLIPKLSGSVPSLRHTCGRIPRMTQMPHYGSARLLGFRPSLQGMFRAFDSWDFLEGTRP